MSRISDMQFAAAQFGSANRVVADDTGMGGFYVAVPKMTNAQLMDGGDNNVHPAFIVNGVVKDEVLIAKYPAFVKNNRAYSLPGVAPRVYVNFDDAVQYCKNKGEGHHLISNAEFAMLALWCKKNGTMPRGNTSYGASSDKPTEVGLPATKGGDGKTYTTMTAPAYPSWYHNGDLSGISDLCGNVWEWNSGFRINGGKIQVLANNDAALPTADFSAGSSQWKEILASTGELVAPGTEGTLGYDIVSGKITLSAGAITPSGSTNHAFEQVQTASGLTIPQIAKSLAIVPADASGYSSDNFWLNKEGERLPVRGGSFRGGACSGVFALDLSVARSDSGSSIGFRAAFVS